MATEEEVAKRYELKSKVLDERQLGMSRMLFSIVGELAFFRKLQLEISWVEPDVARATVVIIAREPQLAGDGEDVTRTITRLYRNQPAALRARFWSRILRRQRGDQRCQGLLAHVPLGVLGERFDCVEVNLPPAESSAGQFLHQLRVAQVTERAAIIRRGSARDGVLDLRRRDIVGPPEDGLRSCLALHVDPPEFTGLPSIWSCTHSPAAG